MALFISVSEKINYAIGGDNAFVLPGVTIWYDASEVIGELNGTFPSYLKVDGHVIGGEFGGVFLINSGSALDRVAVGALGTVDAADNSNAITMWGSGAQVWNAGAITGGSGVSFSGALFGSVTNLGTITGLHHAGLDLDGSNSVQVTNHGTIQGAIGITLDDSYAQITNVGTILGLSNTAINSLQANGATVIRNSGLISAPVYAIQGGAISETVTNRGTIEGDVVLNGGADTFRGRHGWLEGALFGGDGADELTGGRSDDDIFGDKGIDTLAGGEGDDRLDGGDGADILAGGAGDDWLNGGTGADVFAFRRGGGDDIVDDFTNGLDKLDLGAFHFASFTAVAALARNAPGGMLLDLTTLGGGTAFLEGFSKALFDAADVTL